MNALWMRALESAEAARVLLSRDLYNSAGSAAYFAMFNAARALLEEKGGIAPETIKRHSTVLRLFSDQFIRSGVLSVELGRAFRRAAETRGIADYQEAGLDHKATEAIIADMEQFMAVCKQLFSQGPKP